MTTNSRIKSWLWIGFVLSPFALMASCAAYVYDLDRRTAKADLLVDELCEKYAGITVYEQVEAPAHYFRPGLGNQPPFTPWISAPNNKDPFVYGNPTVTLIVTGNPTVGKIENPIIRRSDGAVLSKSVSFSRHGGDIEAISIAPLSSQYHCKEHAYGGNLSAATYLNFAPEARNKPRITYELRKKTP